MGHLLTSFRKFMAAEEVPRWFGLSVVLIYLVCLASVGSSGLRQAAERESQRYVEDTEYSFGLLAERLAAEAAATKTPPALGSSPNTEQAASAITAGVFQRPLRDFALASAARWVRVIDAQRVVLASTNASEIGETVPPEGEQAWPPTAGSSQMVAAITGHSPERLLSTPLAPPFSGGALAPGELFLEARLPATYPGQRTGWSQSTWMVCVLAGLGALFAVYRCLRGQLRSVSRIAGRLAACTPDAIRVEDDLTALHISDARDGVTTAWNALVSLAADLQQEVRKAQANTELSRSLQRSSSHALAEALHSVPDGILCIANDGRLTYANATACHLMGWSAEQARQWTLAEAEANKLGESILNVVRQAQLPDGGFSPVSQVVDVESANSSYRVQVVPLQIEQRQGECVVTVRDVSQQVRADKAREDFVAQVTHELRTPLTNIRAYAETLSSGMFDDPKVLTECYNVITKETRRLSRLIEDILSVSQMEIGSIELVYDQVDLKSLLTDSVRDVRGLADEKNLDLQLVLPAKLEPVRADRDKLAVVINNLLGNAIKYTPDNGTVVVGCQQKSDELVITVKDTGIGIDSADHARVFEKFARASDPAVKDIPGTGIGLYTAREIVRRHGGDIGLISKKGQGTTVIVRLPHEASRATALSTK